jgi:hypothetical protein
MVGPGVTMGVGLYVICFLIFDMEDLLLMLLIILPLCHHGGHGGMGSQEPSSPSSPLPLALCFFLLLGEKCSYPTSLSSFDSEYCGSCPLIVFPFPFALCPFFDFKVRFVYLAASFVYWCSIGSSLIIAAGNDSDGRIISPRPSSARTANSNDAYKSPILIMIGIFLGLKLLMSMAVAVLY